MSLFQRALGHRFNDLPKSVRDFHDARGDRTYEGVVTVEHGRSMLASLARKMGGFPAASSNIPFAMSVTSDGDREHWVRRFADHVTASTVRIDPRSLRVYERFGPFSCALDLEARSHELRVGVQRPTLFGVPLPKVISPISHAREWGEDKFHFDIGASFESGELIIRYHGWLNPMPQSLCKKAL